MKRIALYLWIMALVAFSVNKCPATEILYDTPFGVNGNATSGDNIYAPLDSVVACNMTWVRMLFTWSDIETTRNCYNWTEIDGRVYAAESRGLHILADIHYTPVWARANSNPRPDSITEKMWRDSSNYPPDDATYWGEFIAALVERYDVNYDDNGFPYPIKHYGMWNEPNYHEFFAGTADDYFNKILKPGYEALKNVDSSCFVSGPETYWFNYHDNTGTPHWGNEWIERLDTLGGFDYIDVFSYHIYTVKNCSTLDAAIFCNDIDSVRRYMVNKGVGDHPFWVTETGLSTTPQGQYTEQQQASYFVGVFKGMLQREWFNKTFLYEMWDVPWENNWDHGLLRYPKDNTFLGWQNVKWNNGTIKMSTDYHSGSYSCDMNMQEFNDKEMIMRSNWVTCQPDTYEVSVWLKNSNIATGTSSNPKGAIMGIWVKGNYGEQWFAMPPITLTHIDWFRDSLRFTTPSGSDSFRVGLCLNYGKGEVKWDDIHLHTLSNPSVNLLADSVVGFERVLEPDPPVALSYKPAFDSVRDCINNFNNINSKSNHSEAIAYNNGNKMAVMSDGTICRVYESDNKIYYEESSNGGTSWSTKKCISGKMTYYAYNPSIAIDASGRRCVVFRSNSWRWRIWYTYSDDGNTWHNPVLQYYSIFGTSAPSIATEGNTAHIAWVAHYLNWGNPARKICYYNFPSNSPDTEPDLEDQFYKDKDETQLLNDQSIAVSNGTVHIIWQEWQEYGGYMRIHSAIRNGKDNWNTTNVISVTGHDSHFPSIAYADSGKVTAVWTDFSNHTICFSSYNGTSWSSYETIATISSGGNGYPVVINPEYGAVVAWSNTGSTGKDIYFSRRISANDWSTPCNISGSSGVLSEFPHIALSPDSEWLYTIWSENNNPIFDITFSPKNIAPPKVAITSPQEYDNKCHKWRIGYNMSIKWIVLSNNGVTSQQVWLADTAGADVSQIGSGQVSSQDTLYNWTVNVSKGDYRIKVKAWDSLDNMGYAISQVFTATDEWIFNPDFEEGVICWELRGKATLEASANNVQHGDSCAYIHSDTLDDWPGFYQNNIPCNDSTTYWLTWWQKVQPEAGAVGVGIGVWSVGDTFHTDKYTGDSMDWTYSYNGWNSNRFDTLRIGLFGDMSFKGQAWFDNLRLLVDTLPPEISIIYPNGGEYLAIGDTYQVKIRAEDSVAVESLQIWLTKTGMSDTCIKTVFPHIMGDTFEIDFNITDAIDSTFDAYKIKAIAYDPAGHSASDMSDSVFSICTGKDYKGDNWTWTADSTREVSGGQWNLGSFSIGSGVTMKVKPWNGSEYGDVIIHAKSISIAGTFSGDSAGYDAENGPGAGVRGSVSHGSSGAGFGGRGGHGGNNVYDTTQYGGYVYGDNTTWERGSGGGNSDVTLWGKGGKGGAAIKLMCSGNINISGSLRSNGGFGTGSDGKVGGGGSGGGISIETDSLSGNGVISVKGGDGAHSSSPAYTDGGGGGAGRIFIQYKNSNWAGRLDASGGDGFYNACDGQPGTILVRTQDRTIALLSPVNTATNSNSKEGFIKGVELADNWIRLTANDSIVGNVELSPVDSLIINSNSYILANSKGYGHNTGEGAGHAGSSMHAGGGASHFTFGGHGNYYTPGGTGDHGATYDDTLNPNILGSGGGDWGTTSGYWWGGGSGGGRIILSCESGKILLNGSLSANGSSGISKTSYAGGGASGGSILIYAKILAGTGNINAIGGTGGAISNCYGGGGSGGIVTVYRDTNNFTGTILVTEGTKGGGTATDGTVGIIFSDTIPDGYTPASYMDKTGKPLVFKLYQNYPNPFKNRTIIQYSIPTTSKVSLRLYDLTGRCVKALVNEEQIPGYYKAELNSKDYPTGIYFAKFKAGDYKETKKLILMK
ncbi:MAG: T9SS type A sorting domain-containing protein [bacterium]